MTVSKGLIDLFHKHFDLDDLNPVELLQAGGLTEKQAIAIVMDSRGSSITEIAQAIAGSKNTQNAYYALDSSLQKIAKAVITLIALENDEQLLKKFLEQTFVTNRTDVELQRQEVTV